MHFGADCQEYQEFKRAWKQAMRKEEIERIKAVSFHFFPTLKANQTTVGGSLCVIWQEPRFATCVPSMRQTISSLEDGLIFTIKGIA